ncbi:MAG: hypothetical protein ACXWNR_02145, partial [Candidatus Limnocylindrales bacterium]
PHISGPAAVGQTLTASTGTRTNSPTSYSYHGQRCDSNTGASCSDIIGATASTYVVAAADNNHWLRVVVTATNASGSASSNSLRTQQV